jgi:hypothetical protein
VFGNDAFNWSYINTVLLNNSNHSIEDGRKAISRNVLSGRTDFIVRQYLQTIPSSVVKLFNSIRASPVSRSTKTRVPYVKCNLKLKCQVYFKTNIILYTK